MVFGFDSLSGTPPLGDVVSAESVASGELYVEGVVAAALAGLLYLVISSLSGTGEVWASLVTVATFIGGGSLGVGTGVSRAFSGVSFEAWSAAKLDAEAWNITWLPAIEQTTTERMQLESRGVGAPQFRKNLDG